MQVAGGAVLCALGWNLLNSEPSAQSGAQPIPGESMIMRAFYPLTLPLTVDPGAISVAITIGANHAHGVERVLIAIMPRASPGPRSSRPASGSRIAMRRASRSGSVIRA